MSPQRRAAALFDGRHDLELSQTQMLALRPTPGRTKGAEDIRDLQGRTPHGRNSVVLFRVQHLQGADHFAQEVGGDLGIERRRVQLLVPE